ncbi:MAG: hypothetical protein IJH32_11360 [Ruminococcus sp.]|nr:hypothetical protein [Ruminococcus sp.]
MEDKFEKKFKSFLPFIIIIGVIYLFLPITLVKNTNLVFNNIVYIGVFPLTALLCCGFYSYKKKMDIFLALVAPAFYIPSMFLYGNFKYSPVTSLIYLAAYFVCGFLGLLIGDILSPKSKKQEEKKPRRREGTTDIDIEEPSERPHRRTPRKVNTRAARKGRLAHEETPKHFVTEDPYEDDSLDTSTTADDIDAILNEIQNRRSGQ